MLLNKERKRSLQAILVPRPAHWPRAAPSQSRPTPPPLPPADVRETAGTAPDRRLQLTNEAASRAADQPAPRGRRAERRSEMTPQERAIVAQSFRARYALSDRQVLANLRRRHRVELLDEITRLAKVMKGLQDQIDATERRIQTVDRLAMRFERVAELLQDASGAEPTRSATADAQPASDDATSGADAK